GAFTIAVGPRRSESAVHDGRASDACARLEAMSAVTRTRMRMARVYSVSCARPKRSHPELHGRHAVREAPEDGRGDARRDPGAEEDRGHDLQHQADERRPTEEHPRRSLLEILDLDDLGQPLRLDPG